MRNPTVMFVTAVCFLFLLKLKWPKNKNIYEEIKSIGASIIYMRIHLKESGQTMPPDS